MYLITCFFSCVNNYYKLNDDLAIIYQIEYFQTSCFFLLCIISKQLWGLPLTSEHIKLIGTAMMIAHSKFVFIHILQKPQVSMLQLKNQIKPAVGFY